MSNIFYESGLGKKPYAVNLIKCGKINLFFDLCLITKTGIDRGILSISF